MSHHLLIVEDDEGIREGLRVNFEFGGYRVSTAADGVDGLQAALRLKPDLLILDIVLPGMDGFELCRRIRMARLTFPVLMLTVRTNEADLARSLDMGADDLMGKPFSLVALSSRVKALLRHRQAVRAVPADPLGWD